MSDIDVIIGGGEVGSTIYEIISRVTPVAVVDLDKSKQKLPDTPADVKNFREKKNIKILHICFDFKTQDKFIDNVLGYINDYSPKLVVIHSTVKSGTTTKISEKSNFPVFYSASRGVHKRFLEDMEYYTKFWATNSKDKKAINEFRQCMSDAGFKIKQMSTPETLELAKLLTDTTYYGWLISYAQKTKVICDLNNVDYDEMWQFADEIHAKLGNRPKMYPGFIGGHCVIPNLDLLDDDSKKEFNYIKEHNDFYEKWMEEHSS